jgi:hypothetical protein
MESIPYHKIKKNHYYLVKEPDNKDKKICVSHVNQYLGGDFVFFYDELDSLGRVVSLNNTLHVAKHSPIEFFKLSQ